MSLATNKGFSVVEGFILLGVVLLLAGVGYVGWKALTKADETAQSSSISNGATVEVITTKADLEEAEKALSELDFDDSDGAEAQAQASL